MTSEVTEEWKNFEVKMVSNEDIERLQDYLLTDFHLDEPISKFLPRDDKYIAEVNSRIGDKLRSNKNLSLIAIDKDTREIAGVQLVFSWRKEEADQEKLLRNGNNHQTPPNAPGQRFLQRKVLDAIYAPMKDIQLGIFEKFGVRKVAWNFIASTGIKYRGQGMATELHRRMAILLKQAEFKVVFSIYSSPFSRKSAKNNGFTELAKSYYSQAKDKDGKLVLPNATDPEDYASVMVLLL